MFNIFKKETAMKLLTLSILTALVMFATTFNVDAAPQVQPLEGTVEADAPDTVSNLRRHSLSLELLGRGMLYSFNYDYALTPQIALGAGAANYSISSGTSNASAWIIPLYANYYFTQGTHRFFGTAGANAIFASGKIDGESKVGGSGLAGVLGGGYEFRADNGFLFRASPYAFVGKASGVWLGLSFGYSI